MPQDKQAFLNKTTAGKPFIPKNSRKQSPPAAAESTDQPIATLQSTTTLQDAIGSIAGYSAQSTEALATQRDVIADRVAAQMAALLDPDLFLQEVMERTVAKLNQRTVEIPNFFDITLELPPTPKVRQLSATPESTP
jgi:hypothetical protein